jgi:hypothetical protein
MCTGLRDVIVTGMQRSSGCCGECLKYLGAVRELVLFCLSPYDRGKSNCYTYYSTEYQNGRSKIFFCSGKPARPVQDTHVQTQEIGMRYKSPQACVLTSLATA